MNGVSFFRTNIPEPLETLFWNGLFYENRFRFEILSSGIMVSLEGETSGGIGSWISPRMNKTDSIQLHLGAVFFGEYEVDFQARKPRRASAPPGPSSELPRKSLPPSAALSRTRPSRPNYAASDNVCPLRGRTFSSWAHTRRRYVPADSQAGTKPRGENQEHLAFPARFCVTLLDRRPGLTQALVIPQHRPYISPSFAKFDQRTNGAGDFISDVRGEDEQRLGPLRVKTPGRREILGGGLENGLKDEAFIVGEKKAFPEMDGGVELREMHL
nr:hypothetical protein Iba_chr06bCG6240 [Ipomoea batatas]